MIENEMIIDEKIRKLGRRLFLNISLLFIYIKVK